MKIVCKLCGCEFEVAEREGSGGYPIYCSADCRKKSKSKRVLEAYYKKKLGADKTAIEERKSKVNVLDTTLAECKVKGMTYAEYQIQRTLQRLREQK